MSREAARELVAFLRERVGDHLRSVLFYDADDGELVYVRDDVREQYSDDQMADVVRDVRLEAIEKLHQEDLYVHGGLDCTVRCFEDAVEMHFVHDETRGTAVALDGEVFAAHNTFVGACRDIVESV